MKWIWLFGIGIIITIISIAFAISIVFAYTPPSYDDVTLILNDTAYMPPSYDSVILVLEGGVAPPPTDSCSCPSPAAHWYIDISDNCNITANCYNKGYDVHFENGTAGDMVNISAMIVADNFYTDNAGADTIIQTDPTCYLNTTT